MKRTDRLRKEAELTMAKIHALTRHIRNVEDNCLSLWEQKTAWSLAKRMNATHKYIKARFVWFGNQIGR